MVRSLSPNLLNEKDKEYNSPVELYQLFLDGLTLYLTDCPNDVEFFDENGNPKTYTPVGLSRSDIEYHLKGETNKVTLEFDNVNQLFSALVAHNEFRGKKVVIWQVFLDYLNFEDKREKFTGLMDAPVVNESRIELVAYGLFDLFDKPIPGRTYQGDCPWRFGDPETCGVNAPTRTGNVSNVTGNNLIIHSPALEEHLPADYWAYGFMDIENQSRKVTGSGNGWVSIQTPFSTSPVGKGFFLKAGCDKTNGNNFGCGKWNNLQFYGGFLFVPQDRRG